MLNLEELFNKRPFIYYVNGVYYAFGNGVCERCDKIGTIKLSLRYQSYIEAQNNESISPKEAWDIYRNLVSAAGAVKGGEGPVHLVEKFEEFNFGDSEKMEIEQQLRNLVGYFKKHHLEEFCQ